MTQSEAVRLVIWDLDETFWRGTLTEGGITEYVKGNHGIVVALAQRGIMSSICSKNNFETVEKILKDHGIWDYFIFPSIDWTPKGPRVAEIIEAVRLRPQTVMFIDDNPANLAEAKACAPGLQVADVSFVPEMLNNPLFTGKDDRTTTRLAQYKLLERRKADQRKSAGHAADFLRQSGIRVSIDTDIEKNMARAVELINRTNQLNFTKARLPEDPEKAAAALRNQIRHFYRQAGLVRVTDNYGDYGYCGFYLKGGTNADVRLIHYCFSCRILGMGVEKWLFEEFGRPKLQVVGEVLTDLFDNTKVDWINHAGFSSNDMVAEGTNAAIPEVRLRGGCDLDALAHYFSLNSKNIQAETNRVKNGVFVRTDSTANLMPALNGTIGAVGDETGKVGLDATDFVSTFLSAAETGAVLIFSAWADIDAPIYTHKKMSFSLAYNLQAFPQNLTTVTEADLEQYFARRATAEDAPRLRSFVDILRSRYTCRTGLGAKILRRNLRRIFDRIPDGARLAMLLPHPCYRRDGRTIRVQAAAAYNKIVSEEAKGRADVDLIRVEDCVESDQELGEVLNHYDRIVYYRIYRKICQRLAARGEALQTAVAAAAAPLQTAAQIPT